ncbi:hypothetical protein L1987_51637 [Smallanthus sonchifolius]|uniref:Uncharacterized protein n=1 Tax=Smallanthus sonchifolius TaxID=185202 RepID=A0ACB9ERH9_9ASTR|nr:hypothetical protein L1987_51637 [Smallanthus sonchifolius]
MYSFLSLHQYSIITHFNSGRWRRRSCAHFRSTNWWLALTISIFQAMFFTWYSFSLNKPPIQPNPISISTISSKILIRIVQNLSRVSCQLLEGPLAGLYTPIL